MLIKVAKKVLVARSPSDWVYKIWLTCDDTIAVQFKHGQKVKKVLDEGPGDYLGYGGVPGVCCLYPGTKGAVGRELFELARVWPYAGEWVHAFLYKKFGYIKIVPPMQVGCCEAQECCADVVLPPTLHATLVNTSGAACLAGTYALKLDLNKCWWSYVAPIPACGNFSLGLVLGCVNQQWNIGLICTLGSSPTLGYDSPQPPITVNQCDPFQVGFKNVPTGVVCTPGGGTVTIAVTE